MVELKSRSSSDPPSSATSPSLLARVRAGEASAWDRIVTLYAPLVYHWCRRARLQAHDVEDVFQEVFQAVLTHIAEFKKSRPSHTFRGWLFTITRNKIRDHFRRREREPRGEGGTEALLRLSQMAAPRPGDPGCGSEAAAGTAGIEAVSGGAAERELFRRALDAIRCEFRVETWEAFWRTTVDGRSAADVGRELDMSSGAVRVAKSRVLRRLRQEIGDAL
jgi:RNA polymerase sigma-70 factor (ECF subfamily)